MRLFRAKTVDGILASFKQTVAELRELQVACEKEQAEIDAKIIELQDRRSAVVREWGRAGRAADNIEEMLD